MSTQIPDILEALRADAAFMHGVRLWQHLPAQKGEFVDLPLALPTMLKEALIQRGQSQLYSHQSAVYQAIKQGKHALVVTPTASGKTLCYNLPVVEAILTAPETRALYLFPTKALSQDQQAELTELSFGADLGVKIATYDGDTPQSIRGSARETGQIIISNPDMLHAGILPNHPKWIKFFRNLRYIVVDELHSYRGLYGSHVANVLRRLGRICHFYGSKPQFIICSATIGNPEELARKLINAPIELIDKSGAPRGDRHLVVYNPPLIDPIQGIRKGTVNESAALALKTLSAGIKTIVFAKSRIRVELIADYIRSALANHYNLNQGIKVEAYRGGYLPNERRSIEKGLRDGSIHGVVSTNALELGIDIGGLDAAILAGFPGSIASVWQQAGRAGRRQGQSLAIVVAGSAPLDQYLAVHPEYFTGRSPENAYINPDNPVVYLDHLKCAAFELPFSTDDQAYPHADLALDMLVEAGLLRKTGGRWYWSDRSYPAEGVSLRGMAGNVVIIDQSAGKNQVIGEMDISSAKEMLFPDAVYLHRGKQFMVNELNLEELRAVVNENTLNYYTDAVVKRDLKVLYEDLRQDGPGLELVLGDVLVRTQVSKFKKLRFHTHENLGYGEIFLPEDELHTRFAAMVFSETCAAGQAFKQVDIELQGPLMARLGTLLKAVAPAFLLCQAADFGVSERLRDPHFSCPVLYFFDRNAAGSGLSEALLTLLPLIISAAQERVEQCDCREGCPSCIGPRNPEEEIGLDPKKGARQFLTHWFRLIQEKPV